MKLIDDRDARTKLRKLKKKQYDSMMNLSVSEEPKVRLLGEGMITYGGGQPWFYITKGTLRAYLDELDDDYVGTINIGHTDLATFPDRVIGWWTKQDLSLEEGEDGRQVLYAVPHFIPNHPYLEALRALPFELGTSVEMNARTNEELTNDKERNPYGVPVVDSLFIHDFAYVGDAGDVECMGVKLKGEIDMDFDKLQSLLAEEGKSIEDVNKALAALDEPTEEPVAEEPVAEEPQQEEPQPEEPAAEEPQPEEHVEEPKAEEPVDITVETPGAEEFAQALMNLTEQINALRAENEQLKADLAARDASWETFKKNLSVERTDIKKPEVKAKVRYTDGIGEFPPL